MRSPERVGNSIKGIVKAMNSISIEELDSILQSISRDEALGPMIDPTLWGHGGKFETARQTKKVIQAIRDFKVGVSGIGNFKRICQHEWVSAENEVVKSGEICKLCGALRP